MAPPTPTVQAVNNTPVDLRGFDVELTIKGPRETFTRHVGTSQRLGAGERGSIVFDLGTVREARTDPSKVDWRNVQLAAVMPVEAPRGGR